jgi:hypothetical protein
MFVCFNAKAQRSVNDGSNDNRKSEYHCTLMAKRQIIDKPLTIAKFFLCYTSRDFINLRTNNSIF